MSTPEAFVENLLSKAEPEPEQPKAEPAPEPEHQPRQAADDEPADPPPAGPRKLADLARQLEITPQDLFAAVNSDGVSASEAFEAAKSVGSLNADRELFETDRNTLRLEKSAALQEISDYVALLPQGAVSEEAQQQLKAARGVTLEREQQLLLAAVPEWKDPAQKQADVEAMTTYVAQFGLTPADLATVTDHRQMMLLRHVARQQTRLNELLKGTDKPKPKGVNKAKQGRSDKPTSGAVNLTELVNTGLRQ